MDTKEVDRPVMGGANLTLPAIKQQKSDTRDFTQMLAAEVLKAEVKANRDAVLATQPQAPEPPAKEDIAYIREHGMQAYVEEVHKQKMEEMRAEILASMGLSEDALSEMSGAQRSTIEQMINDEIQKRLEANSLMNNDPKNDNGSYLKSMMMANQSSGFFTGSLVSTVPNFREHFAQNVHQDTAYAFFKGNAEEK